MARKEINQYGKLPEITGKMTKGALFYQQRRIRRKSQRQISEELRAAGVIISEEAISRFENGLSFPPYNVVETLFDYMGYRIIPVPKDLL